MQSFKLKFEAIGTKWVIDCFDISSSKKIKPQILNRIQEFDKTYSRFRDDSIVYEMSKKPGSYRFSQDSKTFFDFYKRFYDITSGKFTLLIGNTLSEAGYDKDYSLKPRKLEKVPKESDVFEFDYPVLKMKKPYILDFGGLGKGYLIDIIAGLLKQNGIKSFCIDGGGDIYSYNLKAPLRVGLENPIDSSQVIGVVEINNKSICASSGNRRKWGKFHHIIDPHFLNSPENILATWAVAKDGVTADGLATCLFLVPPQKLAKYFEFEYLILKPDMTFKKSKNFPAELFIKSENLVK